MNKYRVSVIVKGTMVSPVYDGTVVVWAWQPSEIESAAKDALRASGVWFDRRDSDFKVTSWEYIGGCHE